MVKKILIVIPILFFLVLLCSWIINVMKYHDEKILDGYIDHYNCHMDIDMDYNTYREYHYELKDDEKFNY